jgi:UDP-N-acetylglucosamine transferase subunit ALG13
LILVTLGTQVQQFLRLMEAVDQLRVEDEIIVQVGETFYKSDHLIIHKYISMEQMDQLIESARLVITHGGTGSIVSALKKHKKVIACARKKEYGEHLDDHQEEIVRTFSGNGYILSCDNMKELQKQVDQIDEFYPKVFQSQSEKFIERLQKQIDSF